MEIVVVRYSVQRDPDSGDASIQPIDKHGRGVAKFQTVEYAVWAKQVGAEADTGPADVTDEFDVSTMSGTAPHEAQSQSASTESSGEAAQDAGAPLTRDRKAPGRRKATVKGTIFEKRKGGRKKTAASSNGNGAPARGKKTGVKKASANGRKPVQIRVTKALQAKIDSGEMTREEARAQRARDMGLATAGAR